MKTSRSWWIWASLGICAVLVFGAMTWFSHNVIATEEERALAERRADQQERVRLALWRMDSLGTSILLDESQREETTLESRLPVRTRFQMNHGELSISGAAGQLNDLRSRLAPDGDLRKALRAMVRMPSPPPPSLTPPSKFSPEEAQRSEKDQDYANVSEQTVRSKAVESTLQRGLKKEKAARPATAAAPMEQKAAAVEAADGIALGGAVVAPMAEEREEPTAPQNFGIPRVTWVNGELFLVRRVLGVAGERYDGAWIDLEALKTLLLAEARDLLPHADLGAATTPSNDGLVLASFPLRLDEGAPVSADSSAPYGMRDSTLLSLTIGWMAALLAMATAALLMRGVMRLSERRASFVSAVTHELRTPLTTFRLYSDMLESGAVKEEKRGQYLRVLSREADRLAHLVENVLAFSRIERGSARSVMVTTPAAQLLEPMRERFETRLAAVGLTLEMDLTTVSAATVLRVDSAAVEHILFNLIDNAAKYAANSRPPQVEIHVSAGKTFEIQVADHGPGIPKNERRRIFHAFHKSAHDAAESKPGVGLGLALSRRLARSMGGSLRYEARQDGACFILGIPG